MSSSPKISVLIPAYNAANSSKSIEFMTQAFHSLQLQTLENWEAVVVNDGSTDDTLSFLKKWEKEDSRIRVIEAPQNGGISKAINLAAKNARGDLFARMDIDDMSAPNRFEKQIEFLENHQDIDFVGAGMYVINDNSHILEVALRPETHEAIIAFSIKIGCPFVHGSIMMKRSLFEKTGGYPEDKQFDYCEDYEMWLRVLKCGRAHNIQGPLYFYRQHEKNISKLKKQQQETATTMIKKKFKETFPQIASMKKFDN